MSTEKDFSLLRPFDREAAKRGEMLCWYGNAQAAKYWAGPDVRGTVAIEWDEGNKRVRVGQLEVVSQAHLRMSPLCWVEGRPVYKGDDLYRRIRGQEPVRVTADHINRDSDGDVFLHFSQGGNSWVEGPDLLACDLTWTTPKVKRTGWVLLVKDCGVTMVRNGKIYDDKDKAERVMDKLKGIEAIVGCFPFDYEEPAGQEGGA